MRYPYTSRDLLADEPYHYHFSAIQGLDLLKAWHAERSARLADLAAALGEDDADPMTDALIRRRQGEAAGLGFAASNARPGDADTLSLLSELAARVLAGIPLDAERRTWLTELVRKFEIFKRLRLVYDSGWRKQGDGYAPVEAYALLAFLVAEHAEGPDDLRALNALLKLNDLLLSLNTPLPRLAAAALAQSVTTELRLVGSLAAAKGVL